MLRAASVTVVLAEGDDLVATLRLVLEALEQRATYLPHLAMEGLGLLSRASVDGAALAECVSGVLAHVSERVDLSGLVGPMRRDALVHGLSNSAAAPKELALRNCGLDETCALAMRGWLAQASEAGQRTLDARNNNLNASSLGEILNALEDNKFADALIKSNPGFRDVKERQEQLARRRAAPPPPPAPPPPAPLDDGAGTKDFVQFIKATLPSWKSLSDAERILLVQHSGTLATEPGQELLNDLAVRTAADATLRDSVIARLEGAADVRACQEILASTLAEVMGGNAARTYREAHGLSDGG